MFVGCHNRLDRVVEDYAPHHIYLDIFYCIMISKCILKFNGAKQSKKLLIACSNLTGTGKLSLHLVLPAAVSEDTTQAR